MKTYKVKVWKCVFCGSVLCTDEMCLDDDELKEHCMGCSATIDDFEELGVVEVEAENVFKAYEKARKMFE